MPYLISDISDDTELLPVNAALSNPTYPLFYDLASETVKVLAGANTTEWQVARGVGNTQAVRHSRGTPLILNSSPYGSGGSVTVEVPPAAAVALSNIIAPGVTVTGHEADFTGTLQFRLLGPYAVAFDDFGGSGGNFPVELAQLTAGQIVIDVWVEITQVWNNTSPKLAIGIAPSNDLTNSSAITASSYVAESLSVSDPTYIQRVDHVAEALNKQTRVRGAASLIVWEEDTGGTPTTGAADIYAIVATVA